MRCVFCAEGNKFTGVGIDVQKHLISWWFVLLCKTRVQNSHIFERLTDFMLLDSHVG